MIHKFLFTLSPTAIAVNTIDAHWTYNVLAGGPLDCPFGGIWEFLCNTKLYANSITISALNNYPES
jgi:hypothetical protein